MLDESSVHDFGERRLHLKSTLDTLRGPPKTFLRVFADVRLLVPTVAVYFLLCWQYLGIWPAVAIIAAFFAGCRALLF
jgi:hypothetical protein